MGQLDFGDCVMLLGMVFVGVGVGLLSAGWLAVLGVVAMGMVVVVDWFG